MWSDDGSEYLDLFLNEHGHRHEVDTVMNERNLAERDWNHKIDKRNRSREGRQQQL